MADHFYGVAAPGANADPDDVTKDTSTTAAVVELRVTDATTGMTKNELLKAIDSIRNFVIEDDNPA